MSAQDRDRFSSIGSYTPPDGQRLLDALSRAKIEFQIECDDGIRFWPTKMGHFGQDARIRVFVDRDQIPQAASVQVSLFSE